MSRRSLALGLLLASLLSIGWWIRYLMTPEEPQVRTQTAESPDYYAEQLTVHSYDRTGRLEQTLKTPEMKHFASNATSELTRPLLWRFNPDAPPWLMQAEKALANSDQDQVFMPGEVTIDRAADANSAAYHMVTRDLTLETTNAHATTAAAVRIENGRQWITAIGMEGWLKAPVRLHLLNKVRGRYVFD